MLAATGEQASSALLAIALQAEGMESVSYAGWQVPIRTNSAYTKARIESIDDKRVRADLAAGQGGDRHRLPGHGRAGNITTLGRGGSDTSAVAVAAAMKAARMPDLHRRGWRLHHRPARGARSAAPAHREL
jgi:aspartate kinase